MNGSTGDPARQEARFVLEAPFHPELEQALIAALRARALSGQSGPQLLLVPSREIRTRLRRVLADAGVSTFDLRFRLFPELAEEVLAAAEGGRPGEAPTLVRGAALRVLLGGVVRRWRADGKAGALAGVVELGGFLPALQAALAELEDAGVEPADLARLSPGGAVPRIKDLASLQAAWRDVLAARGLETRARRIARAAAVARALPAREILVYGFYDLTGVQRRLLAALGAGRTLRLFLPAVSGEAGAYVEPLRSWLRGLGFVLAERPSPAEGDSGFRVPGTCVVFSAAGERREAEEVVRRLLRRLAGGGLALNQVAVLYRAAEPYAACLREALERAGLPAHHHDPAPLSGTVAGAVARLYLAAAGSDFRRRELLDFFDAALPVAPRRVAGDGVLHAAEWAALSAEAGLTGGRRAWEEGLPRLEAALLRQQAAARGREDEADGEGDPGEASRARHASPARRLESLRQLRLTLPPLFDAFARLQALRAWHDLAHGVREELAPWLPPGAAGEAVLEALNALGVIERTGEPADLAGFAAAFEETLAGLPAPELPDDPEGLFVGGVMDARGLAFKVVYLVGLNEQVFPRASTPDPFLRDAERERLQSERAWLPLRRRAREEEATLFGLVMEAASEVTLSWSRVEPAQARPRLASSFLLRLLAEREGRYCDHEALEALAERVPLDRLAAAADWGQRHPATVVPEDSAQHLSAWHALDRAEFDRLLVSAAVGAGAGGRILGLAARVPALARALRADEARWGEPRLTAWDGLIQSEAGQRILARRFGEDAVWSPTALESYAACPFRFFVERLLEAEEPEDPEELTLLSPLDRGELLHSVLREFLADPAEVATLAAEPERHRTRLQTIGRRQLAAFEAEGLTGRPLMWALEQARLLDDLEAWLDFELERGDALRPERLELRFGMSARGDAAEDPHSSAEPLVVWAPDGRSVRFRGRIDRVDLDETRTAIRVIDYKSGVRPAASRAAGFDVGESLQLPVYLLAAAARFEGVRAGRAEYLFLGGGAAADALEETDFATLGAALARFGLGLSAGIRAGHFFGSAGAPAGGCSECRLGVVCGGGIERRLARKSADPAIVDWLRLKGAAAAPEAS